MAQTKYMTIPVATDKMPPAVPYILANEASERFAFYGVKTIMTVFLLNYLLDMSRQPANMSENGVIKWASLFMSAVYMLPLLGAVISDAFLGKFRTIIIFSVLYCFGYLAIVLDQTYAGILIGFSLIAVGTGIIKPAVSANVGDQFGRANQHLMSKTFGWFYFAVNFGAFVTSISAPYLLDSFGPKIAFSVPGIFMILALFIYWFSRRQFVHRPPAGLGFVKETFSGEGLTALAKVSIVFLFVSMFWCLFDQTTTAWVIQAGKMNRQIVLGPLKFSVLSSQLQAINPALVMGMIPLFTYIIYPAMNKVFNLTSLKKIAIGFFLAAGSFAVSAWIESQIEKGLAPHVIWQFVAYVIITAAEIMVSITVIEFSYTQSPPKMKSFLSSIGLLPVSIGAAFTAVVNGIIENPDGTSKLPGADYYWFFTGAMVITAILFIFVAAFYKEKTYLQDHAEPLTE